MQFRWCVVAGDFIAALHEARPRTESHREPDVTGVQRNGQRIRTPAFHYRVRPEGLHPFRIFMPAAGPMVHLVQHRVHSVLYGRGGSMGWAWT